MNVFSRPSDRCDSRPIFHAATHVFKDINDLSNNLCTSFEKPEDKLQV